MKNMMEYKGYLGSVEYSEEDNCLFGKIQGIRGLISYEGESLKELKEAFCFMVDDYLKSCKDNGKKPEKPFKGGFNIRVSEDLHYKAVVFAEQHKKSLNKIVTEALEKYIA